MLEDLGVKSCHPLDAYSFEKYLFAWWLALAGTGDLTVGYQVAFYHVLCIMTGLLSDSPLHNFEHAQHFVIKWRSMYTIGLAQVLKALGP